jgi:hypothetical protein
MLISSAIMHCMLIPEAGTWSSNRSEYGLHCYAIIAKAPNADQMESPSSSCTVCSHWRARRPAVNIMGQSEPAANQGRAEHDIPYGRTCCYQLLLAQSVQPLHRSASQAMQGAAGIAPLQRAQPGQVVGAPYAHNRRTPHKR